MEYNYIVKAHFILVTIFLVHYVIKLALLLLNKNNELANYTAKTKIVEMIVSAGFLLTGVALVILGPPLNTLQVVKILMVLTSIPIAIVGFKKGKKILAVIAVLLIVVAFGLAEMNKAKSKKVKVDTTQAASSLEAGKIIYSQQCVSCHGEKGEGGVAGAKNLRETVLSANDQKAVIKNGKNTMPPYPNLTDEQLNGLVEYIQTLK